MLDIDYNGYTCARRTHYSRNNWQSLIHSKSRHMSPFKSMLWSVLSKTGALKRCSIFYLKNQSRSRVNTFCNKCFFQTLQHRIKTPPMKILPVHFDLNLNFRYHIKQLLSCNLTRALYIMRLCRKVVRLCHILLTSSFYNKDLPGYAYFCRRRNKHRL
jgi:hypothetical protein